MKNREKIAFVQGARWWQYYQNGATAFPSEVNEMEAEASRRQAAGTLGVVKEFQPLEGEE